MSSIVLPENCPFCSKKIEKGYVITNFDIRWTKEKEVYEIFSKTQENLIGSHWIGTNEENYRCPYCQIVFFSYDKKKERLSNNHPLIKIKTLNHKSYSN